MATPSSYPRPDFVRPKQNWELLNGTRWSLIFDDQDIGLSEGWHVHGPPDKVAITGASSASSTKEQTAEDARRLANFPELKEKGFVASGATENVKKPINVPFVFQCPASGWGDNAAHEVLWYETPLTDLRTAEERALGHRVLVRFGAVDYEASIWVGGRFVGGHRGGHVPFDVDVTDALEAAAAAGEGSSSSSKLVMRVRDSPSDLAQPRGKQYWAPTPESIFYTPSSGIWQSVWVEVVPRARIAGSSDGTILRSDDIESGVLKASIAVQGRRAGGKYTVEVEGSIGGVVVGAAQGDLPVDKEYVNLDLDLKVPEEKLKKLSADLLQSAPLDNASAWRNGLALWSPDFPLLYDLKLRLYDSAGQLLDEVETYTGMRNINWTTGDTTFRLNGQPLFQSLCLDQGYWPETGITPPNPESLKVDIELSKKMGLNGCRKHQKVEDPYFLYWADKLGFLVWGEIANAYEFSHDYKQRFDQEWTEAVKRDINHPSIVAWTPNNESWGYPSLKDNVEQRNHLRSLYYLTKSIDPTRPINDNCGWEHVLTDLTTFHDYNDAPALAKSCATLESILTTKLANHDMFVPATADDPGAQHKTGAPIICTEFAGVNIAPPAGEEKGERDWGYTTASDSEDLLKRVGALVEALLGQRIISGFVYTQLTDIEQEVNGLYTFDRKPKLDQAGVKEIFDKAAKAYYDAVAAKK
ncbi:glycoside hydrolase superfamily [Xylariales sp. PMI_506]|nr:glycoside hydrolase superfamily [Xylariales sp. PMI_506]